MGLAVKILNSVRNVFKSNKKTLTTVEHLAKNKPLLSFGKDSTKCVKLRIKPDITMPVNPATIECKQPIMTIDGAMVAAGDTLHTGELGNVAIRLADGYKSQLKSSTKEIKRIFEGYCVQSRAKGANSVYSKLETKVKKKGLKISTQQQASELIQDAIGARIIMPDLTKADVFDAIGKFKIRGRNLNPQEQKIMTKYFNGEKLTRAEKKIACEYERGIKLLLAEKQSDPVLKQTMSSAIADALNRKVTTMQDLKAAGIREDILEIVTKKSNTIQPLRITEINNYRSQNGIPYFSKQQIKEFERLQIATGETFDIISCPISKKWNLSPLESKAIKESGYTTFQMNATLSNGALAEIQIRGNGPFGEIEHLGHDSRLGKNTLGPIYGDYKAAIKALNEKELGEYNKYLSECYEYYRDKELGINIKSKPQLNPKFNPILSEDSMWKLHSVNEADQAMKSIGFKPYYETVTAKAA